MTINDLATDSEFSEFRELPEAYRIAVGEHCNDPKQYLRTILERVRTIESMAEFQIFRRVRWSVHLACLKFGDDAEAFLRDVTLTAQGILCEPEFTHWRARPASVYKAVMQTPYPREYLRKKYGNIDRMLAKFPQVGESKWLIRMACDRSPANPEQWLISVFATINEILTEPPYTVFRSSPNTMRWACVSYGDPRAYLLRLLRDRPSS